MAPNLLSQGCSWAKVSRKREIITRLAMSGEVKLRYNDANTKLEVKGARVYEFLRLSSVSLHDFAMLF